MTREVLNDPTLKKLPPNSLEAERYVLGAIILDNTAICKVIDIIKTADFFAGARQKTRKRMPLIIAQRILADSFAFEQQART